MESQHERVRREIGQRLRAAREAVHPRLTQQDAATHLARELGEGDAPSSRVSNYENGRRLIDPVSLQILCRLYEVHPSTIYGFREAPQSKDEDKILEIFRRTDSRGKRQILGVAESQPVFVVTPTDLNEAKSA
jgi:transcriptional regulator with XRE-family HTH domain